MTRSIDLNDGVAVDNRYMQFVEVRVDSFGASRIRLNPRMRYLAADSGIPAFAVNRLFVDRAGMVRIRGAGNAEMQSQFMKELLTTSKSVELVSSHQYLVSAYRQTIRDLVDTTLLKFLDDNEVADVQTHNEVNDKNFIQIVERAPLLAQLVLHSGVLKRIPVKSLLKESSAWVAARSLESLHNESLTDSKVSPSVSAWLSNSPLLADPKWQFKDRMLKLQNVVEEVAVDKVRELSAEDFSQLARIISVEPSLGPAYMRNTKSAKNAINHYLPPHVKVQYRRREHLAEYRVFVEMHSYVRAFKTLVKPDWSFATIAERANLWHDEQRSRETHREKIAAMTRPRVIYPHFELKGPITFDFEGFNFEVKPLLTRAELITEGRAMKHCIGNQYDGVARNGQSVLFSVTSPRADLLRATLETDPRGLLVQLLHFRNGVPSEDFQDAVEHAIRPLRSATFNATSQPILELPDPDTFPGLGINLI